MNTQMTLYVSFRNKDDMNFFALTNRNREEKAGTKEKPEVKEKKPAVSQADFFYSSASTIRGKQNKAAADGKTRLTTKDKKF